MSFFGHIPFFYVPPRFRDRVVAQVSGQLRVPQGGEEVLERHRAEFVHIK